MKFKKPSESQVKDTIALAGGAVGGAMASRGIFGVIHNPKATEDPAQLKKDSNAAMMKRAGLIVAAGVAAAFITGNDAVTSLVKGACVGVAGQQSVDLIAQLSAKSSVAAIADGNATVAQKFMKNAMGLGTPGLGCGCNNGLGNPYPVIERFAYAENENAYRGMNGNLLELAVSQDPWAA